MAKTDYKQLGGRGRLLFNHFAGGYFEIWEGSDHLLQVENRRGSEFYQKLNFSDIQGITVRKTPWGMIRGIVIGTVILIVILLTGVLNHFIQDPTGLKVLWTMGGILLGMLLIGLIVNLVRGPSCSTWIQTSVQVTQIPGWCHMRKTVRELQRIRTRIEEIQGALLQEHLVGYHETIVSTQPLKAVGLSSRSKTEKRRPFTGLAHRLTYSMVTLECLLVILILFIFKLNIWLSSILQAPLSVASIICLIVALSHQSQANINMQTKRMTWVLLGTRLLFIFAGTLVGIFLGAQDDFNMDLMAESTSYRIYSVFYIVSMLTISAVGWTGLERELKRIRQTP